MGGRIRPAHNDRSEVDDGCPTAAVARVPPKDHNPGQGMPCVLRIITLLNGCPFRWTWMTWQGVVASGSGAVWNPQAAYFRPAGDRLESCWSASSASSKRLRQWSAFANAAILSLRLIPSRGSRLRSRATSAGPWTAAKTRCESSAKRLRTNRAAQSEALSNCVQLWTVERAFVSKEIRWAVIAHHSCVCAYSILVHN